MKSVATNTTVATTVRLSPRIKTAAARQARRDHLSFSDVVRVLLLAYAKGEIEIDVRAKAVEQKK
tara:strand:- start:1187 stop:1381 length:195 start_codon:yes stop_codon:yes gene_type:complete